MFKTTHKQKQITLMLFIYFLGFLGCFTNIKQVVSCHYLTKNLEIFALPGEKILRFVLNFMKKNFFQNVQNNPQKYKKLDR